MPQKKGFVARGPEVQNGGDRVNHPHYYQDPSGIECIDIIRHRDFNIGSAIKYLWRAGLKSEEGMDISDKAIEDLQKAIFYIKDEIELIKKKRNENNNPA